MILEGKIYEGWARDKEHSGPDPGCPGPWWRINQFHAIMAGMNNSSENRTRVLFLCTGNSCRSQMAEGWARALRSHDLEAHSAGIETHGLNPNAVKVMAEAGCGHQRTPQHPPGRAGPPGFRLRDHRVLPRPRDLSRVPPAMRWCSTTASTIRRRWPRKPGKRMGPARKRRWNTTAGCVTRSGSSCGGGSPAETSPTLPDPPCCQAGSNSAGRASPAIFPVMTSSAKAS